MGQGLYNLIGWGVLAPPSLDDNDKNEELFEELEGLNLHRSYECEPDYLVVPLAVDDEVLQDWWQLPDFPENILRCPPRKAMQYLVGTSSSSLTFDVPPEAIQKWKDAQTRFNEKGLTLLDAELILINDWD